MIGTRPGDAADDTPALTAALKRLDDALDPRDYATTLTTGPGVLVGDQPARADQ